MTTYRRRVERHACTMFAPEIRDSRTCGVCQRDVGEHARHAIPPVPSRSVQSTRVELASPDDLPRTALISPITKPFQPVQRLTNGFTPSQTSAFSEYDRLNASPSDVKSLRKNGTTSPQCQEALSDSEIIKGTILIKPQPRYALKPSNSATTTSHFRDITYASNKTTPVCSQDNRKSVPTYYSSSTDNGSINGGRGSRSTVTSVNDLGDPETSSQINVSSQPPLPRSENFREILDRFQSAANKRMLRQRERRRITKSSDASRRYTVSSVQLDASASVEDSHHRTHLSPSERDSGTSQMTHSSRGRSPEKKPFLTISVPTKHSNGHRSIPRHWMDTKETSVGGGDGAISIVATNGATRNPPIHPPQNGAHKDSNVSIAFRERSSRSCSAQRGNVIYIGTDNGSVKFRDHSQRALPISPLSQKDINTNQNSPPLSQGSDCSVPEIDSKPTESPVPCTPLPPHVWPELSSPNHKSKLNADERVKKLEEKYEQINQDNLETLFLITSRNEYYPLISSETIAPSVLQRLRFSDIIFKSSAPFLVRRSAAFYEAFLPNNKDNDPSITVMITPARRYFPFASFQRVSSNRCTWSLPVLAEIEDRNRKMGQFLQESMRTSHSSYKITIMPRLHIIPFHTFASRPLQQGCSRLEHERLVSFILIQLVCALKSLQSDGIESLSSSFDEFLICYPSLELGTPKDFEDHPRLLLLSENILDVMKEQSNQAVGVCEYALRALRTLLLTSTDNTSVNDGETSIVSTALQKCAELLPQEKSNSLTETKKLLEFAFWVGDRVKFSCEFDAQIWLDVQRARAVNHILRSKIKNSKSTVKLYEFMQTQFLLSVTHQSLFSTYSVLTHLTKESSF